MPLEFSWKTRLMDYDYYRVVKLQITGIPFVLDEHVSFSCKGFESNKQNLLLMQILCLKQASVFFNRYENLKGKYYLKDLPTSFAGRMIFRFKDKYFRKEVRE